MHDEDGVLAWAAIDFLCALLLVVYTLIAPVAKPPRIMTLGQYAVTMTWHGKSDIDLWGRTPGGDIVWFAAKDGGGMDLEHDCLGSLESCYTGGNFERMIVRTVEPGEYVFNAVYYAGDGPVRVTLQLWRIAGADVLLKTQRVELGAQGEEQTAFRVTLHTDGRATNFNRLPRSLMDAAGQSP